MSNIKFKSMDNRFSVEISGIFLDNIKCECIKSKDLETGGILFGNYSVNNCNAIVSSITGPSTDSKHTMCTFELGVDGLNEIIDENWKQGHYYIGEWHYHPNSSPKPSIDDDKQMEKNVVDELLKCSVPILLIVGGNPDNYWNLSVNVYTKNRKITLEKV